MNASLTVDVFHALIPALPPVYPARPYAAQVAHNALTLTIATVEAMRALADTLPRIDTGDTRIVDADDVVAHLDDFLHDAKASLALLVGGA